MKVNSKIFYIQGLTGFLLVTLALPIWALTPIEIAKLLASDGAPGDLFGHSVALDGDTALIGAYDDDDAGRLSGSAYIFTRNAGVWTEQAKLTASDASAGDYFGWSVALDGDTALIGAKEGNGAGTRNGSAYVFTVNAGMWTEQAKLTANDAAVGDQFGFSVALDGDTALIGSRYDNEAGYYSGSAYVFERSAGMWTEQAKLIGSDSTAHDLFGSSVALDGDTALISNLASSAGYRSGSAYVFTLNAGIWTEQAILTASDGEVDDGFGTSAALDGGTALIGAPYDDAAAQNSGSVYVFVQSAGMWTEQAKLIASDGTFNDLLGTSVALDDDTALVGATGDNVAGTSSGSAYIFMRNAGVWTEQAKLTASDGAYGDLFGGAVAVDDDTALVTAPGDEDAGHNSGSAYVYSLISDTVTVTIDIKPGNKRNVINPSEKGGVWVALLSDTNASSPFDPSSQVDIQTVEFGPDGAKAVRHKVKDVNEDGIGDLLLRLRVPETGIACGDTEATLTGETFDAQSFTGADSVKTVGCKKAKKAKQNKDKGK